MKYAQLDHTTQADTKYTDLRPTVHSPQVARVIRLIWRELIPTIEQRLARGRKGED